MGGNKRVSKQKQMKPIFFVFCEGETEISYVRFLRSLYRVPILVIPKKSKSSISKDDIERSKREYLPTERDKVFLMFDLDIDGMLEHLSKIPDVVLLVSNPCVELWFLLHYQEQKTELSTDMCIQLLQKVSSEYKKGIISEKERRLFSDNRNLAIKRAKCQKEYQNPSTTIYRLLELLDSCK